MIFEVAVTVVALQWLTLNAMATFAVGCIIDL